MTVPAQEMPLLWVVLAFLALPPHERIELLPPVWQQPVYIDNGYCLRVEQPMAVMQDFCYEQLHLCEDWEDDTNFTALALAAVEDCVKVEAILLALKSQAHRLTWQEWQKDERSIAWAKEVLHLLQWPALLNANIQLTQQLLYYYLDSETYGTFTAALKSPKDWQIPL